MDRISDEVIARINIEASAALAVAMFLDGLAIRGGETTAVFI